MKWGGVFVAVLVGLVNGGKNKNKTITTSTARPPITEDYDDLYELDLDGMTNFNITENESIQFDPGIIYRGFVVALFCFLIFFCSCCIKRRCSQKSIRRYDLLEERGLHLADSDSDVDIFEKIQK